MDTESWCVKCDEDNKKVLSKWLKNFKESIEWSVNITAYYGLKNNVPYYGSFDKPLNIIFSTEEFYQKISLIKEIQYEIC